MPLIRAIARVGLASTVTLSTAIPAAAQSAALRGVRWSAAPAGDARQQTPPPQSGLVWDNRPVVRFGPVELSVRARVQGDHRVSDAPFLEDDESAFEIVRKRIGLEGDIANGFIAFEVERELTSADPWRDVFVNYGQFTAAQVRAGKFKLPFSLDENTSIANIDFVNRSLAARYLAPGRDWGVMVHGRVLSRVVRYEAGIFRNDGDNAHSPDSDRVRGGRTRAAHVQVLPFRAIDGPISDVLVGAGWTSSDLEEGFSAIRGRAVLEQRFFASDYPVKGTRTRTGLEMRWRPGPVSVRAEIIRVSDERREQSVEDTDLPPLRAIGWYVSGSWLLTGEPKADGVEPRRPLFRGGVGAIEIAARLEDLRFESGSGEDPSTSPRAEVIVGNANRSSTVGINWYLNRWFRMQLNLIRETLQDPEQGPLPIQPTWWSRIVRFQFVL